MQSPNFQYVFSLLRLLFHRVLFNSFMFVYFFRLAAAAVTEVPPEGRRRRPCEVVRREDSFSATPPSRREFNPEMVRSSRRETIAPPRSRQPSYAALLAQWILVHPRRLF